MEILQHGNRYVGQCKNCKCVVSCKPNEIHTKTLTVRGADAMIDRGVERYSKYVAWAKCPECNAEIILDFRPFIPIQHPALANTPAPNTRTDTASAPKPGTVESQS